MWWIDATLSLVAAAALLVIFLTVVIPLARTRQIPSNALGTAAAGILIASTLQFLAVASHALSTRTALAGAPRWLSLAASAIASSTGLAYLLFRARRHPRLGNALLYEDADQQHRQGLEINDQIVQGLTVAQMALALDERQKSEEALAAALAAARRIVGELLAQAQSPLTAGDLVRRRPATLSAGDNLSERHPA